MELTGQCDYFCDVQHLPIITGIVIIPEHISHTSRNFIKFVECTDKKSNP